jgi:CheY-like chemotaxis protein
MFRVLLVEDNAFVADLFKHTLLKLQSAGAYTDHSLLTALTGHEALRLLGQEKLDAVILDHYLPGITGCAIIRKLRLMPDYRDVPVLMISMGGDEIRREALDAGATVFLDKPVLSAQLLESLRALSLGDVRCNS